MFEKIGRSWEFAKMSYGIIWDFKRLMIFPILSGISLLLVLASFLLPLWGTGTIDQWIAAVDAEEQTLYTDPVLWVVTFAFYFCNYFVIVFFNSALIACTMQVLRGEVPTIGGGISVAMKRLPQILAWAFVSALVGVALKAIENAHEKAGAIISAVLGTGWSIMTYFTVPCLVMEGVGPFAAIKNSLKTMKETWGEAMVGHFSLGFLSFLLLLPVLAVLFVLGWLSAGSSTMLIATVVIGVMLLGLYFAATSAADTIFKTLLYSYASGRVMPEDIDTDALRSAFGPKE